MADSVKIYNARIKDLGATVNSGNPIQMYVTDINSTEAANVGANPPLNTTTDVELDFTGVENPVIKITAVLNLMEPNKANFMNLKFLRQLRKTNSIKVFSDDGLFPAIDGDETSLTNTATANDATQRSGSGIRCRIQQINLIRNADSIAGVTTDVDKNLTNQGKIGAWVRYQITLVVDGG